MVGIYKITNNINGHFYIGLSNNIKRRFMEHKAPKNLKRNTTLAKAFRKYGIDNFTFEVIEECDIDMLAEREMFYIKTLRPQYNMNEGGKGNLGHRLTEEKKKELSRIGKLQWDNKTDEEKAKIIKNLKGHKVGYKMSESTKEKLRKANLGKTYGEETIRKRSAKMKISMKGNKNGNKKIVKIDKNTLKVICVYESTKCASEDVGTSTSNIHGALKNHNRSAGGYYWRYYSEIEV